MIMRVLALKYDFVVFVRIYDYGIWREKYDYDFFVGKLILWFS